MGSQASAPSNTVQVKGRTMKTSVSQRAGELAQKQFLGARATLEKACSWDGMIALCKPLVAQRSLAFANKIRSLTVLNKPKVTSAGTYSSSNIL